MQPQSCQNISQDTMSNSIKLTQTTHIAEIHHWKTTNIKNLNIFYLIIYTERTMSISREIDKVR